MIVQVQDIIARKVTGRVDGYMAYEIVEAQRRVRDVRAISRPPIFVISSSHVV